MNPLTFFVTYIFPFGDADVFLLHAGGFARDLQRLPILADNRLETARCERQKKNFFLNGLKLFFKFKCIIVVIASKSVL